MPNGDTEPPPESPPSWKLMIKLQLAKIAMASVVKWKRTRAQDLDERHQELTQCEEPERMKYQSRMIHYTRCDHPKETRWMQLRISTGYRDNPFQACRKHERCSHNKCQCNLIWHQCETHRIDTPLHASRKAPEEKQGEQGRNPTSLDSHRRSPELEDEQRQSKNI